MDAAPTSYDEVDYPSLLFRQASPDRLAVIARLHGLSPPPIETARMLEIGGGDGLNAIALAAAFPRAQFVNFDLASQPVARGQRWADAAGLRNVGHRVLDIMDAADALDDEYDYIIAHGVYAWVPDAVRRAVMALIGRRLSPNGVAFVSYNALPGGYSRMALRDMMLHQIGHLTDPAERIAAAQALLRRFVTPGENDAPITAAMRMEARVALTYADGLLYHDQLNGFYAPQSLLAAVADARGNGLRYLGDARGGGVDQGFLDPDKAGMVEDDWLNALQARDYQNGRYFRASLFVRETAPVQRAVVHGSARTMWATTRASPAGGNAYKVGNITIRVADPGRAAILDQLIARRPEWLPVADLAKNDAVLGPLCHLAIEGFIDFHTTAPPFALTPSERPIASALARMQIAEGAAKIATLDQRLIDIHDREERRLIALLDGTRAVDALARDLPADPVLVETMLRRVAAKALLSA